MVEGLIDIERRICACVVRRDVAASATKPDSGKVKVHLGLEMNLIK